MSGSAEGSDEDRLEAEVRPVYLVGEDDEEGDTGAPIGQVELDAADMLTVIEAAPAHAALLADLVAQVNNKAALGVRTTEPGAAQYSVGSVSVGRGTVEFRDALAVYLQRYYRVRLG